MSLYLHRPCISTALALCTTLAGDIYTVVDGSTIKPHEGPSLRLDKLDTPKKAIAPKNHTAGCDAEAMMAELATSHLEELLAAGFDVEGVSTRAGRGGRLVQLHLADGRTASEAMVQDGYGVAHAGQAHDWCGAK